jgi:hypothetical protein
LAVVAALLVLAVLAVLVLTVLVVVVVVGGGWYGHATRTWGSRSKDTPPTSNRSASATIAAMVAVAFSHTLR